MGVSLNEVKQRIASTKKTSRITEAMQMVFVARSTKSEGVSKSFREYSPKTHSVVTHSVVAQSSELCKAE